MRIKDSIDEILAQTDARLAKDFYNLLFNEHPELSDFFSHTNMRRQQLKLMMALQAVAYCHRRPTAAMADFFKDLGVSHRERGIPLPDFSKFRDVLMVAIQKFHGSEWSEELSIEWAAALDSAIELMKAGAKADVSGTDS